MADTKLAAQYGSFQNRSDGVFAIVMKLCIPLMGLNASGGVRVITQLANTLDTDTWQVKLIVPDYAATPYFPLSEGVQVTVVKTHGFNRVMRIFYFIAWLSLFACQDTEVCVANYYLTAFPLFTARWLQGRRARLVYLIQHYEPLAHVKMGRSKPFLISAMLYHLARWSYRLPYTLVTVSTWVKEQIGQEEITVIPNGVDLSIFYPNPSPSPLPPIIGTIGRRQIIKGLDIFLAAVEPLLDRGDMQFHVLTDQVVDLPKQVQTVQAVDDASIRAFYQSCAIFVFPSRIEGFGLPPLEAMASGAAVITTDCGGVREYATPENCLIVPPDDPAALRDAILQLLSDDGLRRRLIAAGSITAQAYSLQKAQENYRQFFGALRKG